MSGLRVKVNHRKLKFSAACGTSNTYYVFFRLHLLNIPKSKTKISRKFNYSLNSEFPDMDNETNCDSLEQYGCGDGTCIEFSQVCDGQKDCVNTGLVNQI